MATEASIEVELNTGSALSSAATALRRVASMQAAAISAMKNAAYASGRSLAQASSASGSVFARDVAQVDRTLRAREAFHTNVLAEAEKYRAAYLGLAVRARQSATEALRVAATSRGDRRAAAIQKASMDTDSAEAMERAAEAVDAARDTVGEPEVVSSAAARRAADDAGVSLANPARVRSVSTDGGSMFSQGPMNVASLMPEFFPEETQRMASALGGLGEAAPTDWWGAVRQSLGLGAQQLGASAQRVGQEETKNNPAAGALVSTVGGLLQSLGLAANGQFNAGVAGKAQPMTESTFPVIPVVIGVGLVGLYLWSRS
ncbi:MAG: hypothetical protein WC700_18220 [Gemmatimonadaceae bacterium]|jgi:hypothetical protein